MLGEGTKHWYYQVHRRWVLGARREGRGLEEGQKLTECHCAGVRILSHPTKQDVGPFHPVSLVTWQTWARLKTIPPPRCAPPDICSLNH